MSLYQIPISSCPKQQDICVYMSYTKSLHLRVIKKKTFACYLPKHTHPSVYLKFRKPVQATQSKVSTLDIIIDFIEKQKR